MAEYRTDEYRTAFRATLHPDYEGISDEQADALLESVMQSLSPQEADAYMEGLGSWLKSAAHTVAKTAPVWAPIAGAAAGSIVPGVGTAIGGAVGGLAGNVAGRLATEPRASGGALASAALQGAVAGGAATGRRPAASAALGLAGAALRGGAPAAAPAPAGVPTAGKLPARPAAHQLMTLLGSPHLSRAVLGQVNGPVGRTSVPVRVGGRRHQVAFGSFINALLHLAQQAVSEVTNPETGSTSYLTTGEGYYAYDPASPEQRTEGLLDLLQQEYEEHARPDEQGEQEDRYAEAGGTSFDPLTEWFLDSGLIRH